MYNYNNRGDYMDSLHRQAVGGWSLMHEMSKNIKKEIKKEEEKKDDKDARNI